MDEHNRESTYSHSSGSTEQTTRKSAGFVQSLRDRATEEVEARKRNIAEQTSKLANVLQRATDELQRSNFSSMASYTRQLAGTVNSFADGLRSRSFDQIVDDTRRAARRNPEMFFLGAIATGLMLSRFLKASERKQYESTRRDYPESSAWGDVAPASGRSASTTIADNLAGGA